MDDRAGGVVSLSARELKDRLDRGEALAVLDVREYDERDYCAIPLPPGATDLHIPMGQVPGSFEELRAAAGASPLVIYCHHGVRSMTVAAWLARRGLGGIHNLDGGIDAWSATVDPGVPRY